jgi:hypothetical protein
MTHLDKLREDVQFWREAASTARETLKIAEGILPGLEAQLGEFEPNCGVGVSTPEPTPEPMSTPAVSVATSDAGIPRFSGQCVDQVKQALAWKPEQGADELQENLKRFGRAYGRGAVSLALRDLKADGLAEVARKDGNVLIFRLTSQA